MPAPFDFPFLPPVLPTGATGVSTGGDTAAPATGNAPATGTSDFASLLSGVLAPATPQTGLAQSGLSGAAPVMDTKQGTVAPAVTANNPPVLPVNTTLLQAQLPAVDSAPVSTTLVTPAIAPQAVIVPQSSAQAALPELVSAQATATETAAQVIPAEGIASEALPAKPAQTQSEDLAVEFPAVEVPVIDAPVPAMAQTEVAVPVSQAEPKASPEGGRVPTPVIAAAPAEPVVLSSVVTEGPVEAEPVITPPVVKTVEAKPAKNKPVETETGKTPVKTDENVVTAPDAASLTVAASVVAPIVTAPVIQAASQPVIAGSDDNSTPAPAGKQPPAAPQAPAPQNQADAADDSAGAPADKAQASAKPNFASLLAAAPALSAGAAAVKPQASATASAPVARPPVASTPVASTPVASTPVASAPVQADAPQTAQAGEAAPTQKPAVQVAQVQSAPVQNAPVQAAQIQTAQAQVTQAQTTQSATRKPVSAPAENTAEIASTPVTAAPSGFSLVSTPVTSDAAYTPATPQMPSTSLLSQTAVDNINALSVQINRRNAEGATKFTMELHPADLGKVDVALSIGRDGKMTAHMTFDSDMTAATFSAHESELRQQLRDTGLQLADDALSFSTRLKTDAVAQAQGHAVNANARSADSSPGDSSSGNSSQQQQPQNTFTQADSQQGQQRPHSQHLAQMASRQAAADQAAADADLDALNSAVDLAAARLNYRQSSSRLALDLSV